MSDVTRFTVQTADDWELPLVRLQPQERRFDNPVLLLHGFGTNGFVMWHDPGPSLGSYLRDEGFLVWCLEFRGTRSSRHPAFRRAFDDICVDEKITVDLPAAIERVLGESAAEKLDVVGHSLGGTTLYAYLASHGDGRVGRCATISSPLQFRLPVAAHAAALLSRGPLIGAALPKRLPMRRFCELGLATNLVFPARPHFNMDNVERGMLLRMMRDGVDDGSLRELIQLVRWSRVGGFRSLDGSVDYQRGMAAVRAPMLLLGAAADQHVPPEALAQVAAALGSDEKEIHIIGRAAGASCDYGHTDLLLGRHAATEVFPHLARWLGGSRP
jgi:pimeloyl-ACP methyl ester carboxylesterase